MEHYNMTVKRERSEGEGGTLFFENEWSLIGPAKGGGVSENRGSIPQFCYKPRITSPSQKIRFERTFPEKLN